MGEQGGLKVILKRGALITVANWPVILVQFVAESLFKILLGVPVIGGMFLVALVVGHDADEAFNGNARQIIVGTIDALASRPAALVGFVLALALVLFSGSALMFIVKGGAVTVLAQAERSAGAIERPPLRWAALQEAWAFSPEVFVDGCRRLARRYLRLGGLLLIVYGLSGALYLGAVLAGYNLLNHPTLVVWWTVVAALASTALVIWITLVNLIYLLIQMIVAYEDVSVREAGRRLVRFVRQKGRWVAGVFLVTLALVAVAMVASIVATAGLSLVSFVPFVGLAVFPLQAAAWLVRGLLFQFLGLTALSSYLTLYREQV